MISRVYGDMSASVRLSELIQRLCRQRAIDPGVSLGHVTKLYNIGLDSQCVVSIFLIYLTVSRERHVGMPWHNPGDNNETYGMISV